MSTFPALYTAGNSPQGLLLLADGSSYQGISFGAETSVGGETVFQTGKTEPNPYKTQPEPSLISLSHRNGWLPRVSY